MQRIPTIGGHTDTLPAAGTVHPADFINLDLLYEPANLYKYLPVLPNAYDTCFMCMELCEREKNC